MLQSAYRASQHKLKQDLMNFTTLTGDIFSDVKDMPDLDLLEENLRDELSQVFVDKHRAGLRRWCRCCAPGRPASPRRAILACKRAEDTRRRQESS